MSRPAEYRRRLLVNTAAHGLSTVWLMVLTLATLPLLLGGLGSEAFGLWVLRAELLPVHVEPRQLALPCRAAATGSAPLARASSART